MWSVDLVFARGKYGTVVIIDEEPMVDVDVGIVRGTMLLAGAKAITDHEVNESETRANKGLIL